MHGNVRARVCSLQYFDRVFIEGFFKFLESQVLGRRNINSKGDAYSRGSAYFIEKDFNGMIPILDKTRHIEDKILQFKIFILSRCYALSMSCFYVNKMSTVLSYKY